jgi:SAM-dependent methyltransferase
MEPRVYELMADTEDRHWWWSGRRSILSAVLGELFASGDLPNGALFDLGCGSGSNLPVLAKFGDAVGLDGSPRAVECAHRRGRDAVQLADLSAGVGALGAYAPGSASLVLFADVLEHLDDEQPALAIADYLLAPGGALVVTVPAFGFLWGPADDFNHHRRRYSRTTLSRVIETRFRVARASYFNFFLFPTIALARTFQNLSHRSGGDEAELPGPAINAALRAVFSAEALWLRRANRPVGVSLLCVARKPRTTGNSVSHGKARASA